ncbi:MAG: glucose-6-phosphate isomerase [Alphaproteobacteria bacterium]|nr:glucose-6-phosphate isomerase [Alphaproteobacteria bacterium]
MLNELPITQDVSACVGGAHGLDRVAYDRLLGAAAAALAGLAADRRGGVPLLALPARRDDMMAWAPIVERYRRLYDQVVVLGTGGSSLGGATLCRLVDSTFGRSNGSPRVRFLDNVDPWTFDALFAEVDIARVGFITISKSGGTAETVMQTLVVIDKLVERLGRENLSTRLTVIAEVADSPLRAIAAEFGLFCLDHDPNIDGRYSALSVTGLLPAEIAGVDVEAVRRGAAAVLDTTLAAGNPAEAPPAVGAAVNVGLAQTRGVSQAVLMPYLDRLDRFAFWYRQLWAESLGKGGHGTTPINALGTVDQHSQLQLYLDGPGDKLFTLILSNPTGRGPLARPAVAGKAAAGLDYLMDRAMGDLLAASQRATADTLVARGRPVRRITFETLNEEVMGALMMHFILETIIAARLLGVNPFGQPAVEDGKILARRYLREAGR